LVSESESLLPDSSIALIPGFVSQAEADRLFDRLRRRISWRRDNVRLFGREHPIPRLHQWYGDPGAHYRWSGLVLEPQPWFAELDELRNKIERSTGNRFNSVLANLYRDGNDSMGWHSDDEPELGAEPFIASLSLGASRDLLLRHRDRESGISTASVPLTHGSLLLMGGLTQSNWQHALPKRRRVTEPRLNLTFRRIVTRA
jgi:alkylated DNA repair dioxygenase AlkB